MIGIFGMEKRLKNHGRSQNSKALKLGCWACFVDLKHSHTYTYCNPNAQELRNYAQNQKQTLHFSPKISKLIS